MNKDLLNALLEKYFSSELNAAEKEKLFNELEKNPSLKEEFQLKLSEKEVIRAKMDIEEVENDDDLKEILSELAREPEMVRKEHDELLDFISRSNMDRSPDDHQIADEEVAPPTRDEIHQRYKRVAAWTGLAAIVGLLFFVGSTVAFQPSHQKLFENYYEKYDPGSYAFRSTNNSLIFSVAIDAYSNGNLETAISAFSAVEESSPYYEDAAFYLPLAYLEGEQFEKAVNSFNSYLTSFHSFQIEASWYLALAYIKLEESEKALDVLSKISNNAGLFQDDVTRLLSRLGRMK